MYVFSVCFTTRENVSEVYVVIIVLIAVLEVMVDHRIMFSTLKKNLEPYIGVPSEHFKIYRHFDVCDESEDTNLSAQFAPYEDSQKLWIQIGSSLRNREFPVKLYQFFLDSTEVYMQHFSDFHFHR